LGIVRILNVVPTYWPATRYGGPIRSVHALCRSLASRGHRVEVFTTSVDGKSDSPVPLQQPVQMDGVIVTYFQSPLLRRLYWSPTMSQALRRRTADFDIVHTHSVFLWPPWAAARSARSVRIPYVASPRGMLVPELIRRKSRWVKTAWITLIERSNLQNAAAIHVTSAIEGQHLESFKWRLPPIVAIPHGVDDPANAEGEALSADIAAAVRSGPIVLALGRINWEKGIDRLIGALPHLLPCRIVIAGDDSEGHAAALEDLARRTGVADRVTILPRHVEGADKEALFAAASVFSMTSLSENFGLAALEALRRGVPVVTTPGVGMADIVHDAAAGAVVAATPQAIASGLNALLGDPPAARAMGEAGRTHVMAHYGWPSVAERMEKLYETILSARNEIGSSI
jgi:glycosyltransferase involved in cell wall biosynthesis